MIPISYETDALKRPLDFKVEIGDITYWIQMRDLSSRKENRQYKIIQQIERAAKEIKVGKFLVVCCQMILKRTAC